jgi:hypothetical protein
VKKRRSEYAWFKARVALRAVSIERTVSELHAECGMRHASDVVPPVEEGFAGRSDGYLRSGDK